MEWNGREAATSKELSGVYCVAKIDTNELMRTAVLKEKRYLLSFFAKTRFYSRGVRVFRPYWNETTRFQIQGRVIETSKNPVQPV